MKCLLVLTVKNSAQEWIKENGIGPYFNDFQRTETDADGGRVVKQFYGLFSNRFDSDLEKKQVGLEVKMHVILVYLQTVKRTSEFHNCFQSNNLLQIFYFRT